MRILITSDTHLIVGARLPAPLLLLADQADHVIHAGDASTLDVLDTIAMLAPITAVRGNVDDVAVCARFPEAVKVELAGLVFGVVHDPGPLDGRDERLCRRFLGCDVIVHGHTHQPDVHRTAGGVLVVNPGSPTQRRRAPWHSICWLELESGRVRACDLVNLDTM